MDVGLAVIRACSDDVQPHEADGVHRDRPVKARFAARHVDAGGIALHIGVRQQRQHAVDAGGNIEALRAVACGVDIGQCCSAGIIRCNAAAHLAACIFDERSIRAHADRNDEHVKIDRKAAFECGGRARKLCGGIAEVELDALLFKKILDDSGAGLIENARQHAVGKVDDRDGFHALLDALCAL